MEKIPFEDGTKIKDAVVEINEQEYTVTEAQYTGNTPLTAANLNLMQDNIEGTLIKVSTTEPNPKSDFWFKKGKNLFNGIYNSECGYNQSTGSMISITNIFSSMTAIKIPDNATKLACSKNRNCYFG